VEAEAIYQRMERTPAALMALLEGLDAVRARRRPPSGAWSIVEIINHLADEEVEDFRARLFSTLDDASWAWAPIDPEGAAADRGYQTRSLSESLERFRSARAESIERLRALESPAWSAAHDHPSLGRITAGDLLACWAAHDALHLRQIAKRLFELATEDGGGASLDYAGSWAESSPAP